MSVFRRASDLAALPHHRCQRVTTFAYLQTGAISNDERADGSSVCFNACAGPCTAWEERECNSTFRPQPLTPQAGSSNAAVRGFGESLAFSLPHCELTESAVLMLTLVKHINTNHPSPSSHRQIWLGVAGWIRGKTSCRLRADKSVTPPAIL